jgi:hypothetical protein
LYWQHAPLWDTRLSFGCSLSQRLHSDSAT